MNLYSKHKLSPAQIRVCDYLLLGMTVQEIAPVMFRSPKTIWTQRRRAFHKMGIRNIAELCRKAWDIDKELKKRAA